MKNSTKTFVCFLCSLLFVACSGASVPQGPVTPEEDMGVMVGDSGFIPTQDGGASQDDDLGTIPVEDMGTVPPIEDQGSSAADAGNGQEDVGVIISPDFGTPPLVDAGVIEEEDMGTPPPFVGPEWWNSVRDLGTVAWYVWIPNVDWNTAEEADQVCVDLGGHAPVLTPEVHDQSQAQQDDFFASVGALGNFMPPGPQCQHPVEDPTFDCFNIWGGNIQVLVACQAEIASVECQMRAAYPDTSRRMVHTILVDEHITQYIGYDSGLLEAFTVTHDDRDPSPPLALEANIICLITGGGTVNTTVPGYPTFESRISGSFYITPPMPL